MMWRNDLGTGRKVRMRKFFLMLAIAVICVATASADGLCTDTTHGNIDVLTPGFFCELGGLTFSNFSANLTGAINLTGAQLVGSVVYLTFNPNMAPTSGSLDRYFYFQVTGGVLGVDLINGGGSVTSIFERVCSSPIGIGNICSQPGTQLAEMTAFGGGQDLVMLDGIYSPIYIYKDIFVPQNGHLSSFTQSFHTPEPLTFGLIGSGLLLLGLLRRRAR